MLAQQAVREGAQDYVVKGEFEGKMLVRMIRCAIERKRAEEESREGAEILHQKQQMETLERTLSELHLAHEELKAAQMQLVQSERLEAVSTFAGGIAHEVKNPLQTILLGVDFLRNSFPEANQDVQMVRSRRRRQSRTVGILRLQQARRERPGLEQDCRACV